VSLLPDILSSRVRAQVFRLLFGLVRQLRDGVLSWLRENRPDLIPA